MEIIKHDLLWALSVSVKQKDYFWPLSSNGALVKGYPLFCPQQVTSFCRCWGSIAYFCHPFYPSNTRIQKDSFISTDNIDVALNFNRQS